MHIDAAARVARVHIDAARAFVALLVIFAVAASPSSTVAQGVSGAVARAVSVQGTVDARRAGQTSWQPVRLNDTFSAGDTVRIGERSRADLMLLDQSVLRLNASTELTVDIDAASTAPTINPVNPAGISSLINFANIRLESKPIPPLSGC